MLDMLDKSTWTDENTVFFEPTCGHGNFVVAIAQRRLEALFNKAKRNALKSPHLFSIANTVNTLWAIDIDRKNITLCKKRVWEVLTNFALLHDERAWFIGANKKNKNFWAHILCCINWQIHENEMLSALKEDLKPAKDEAEQTIIGKRWLAKNGHQPIDFELTWTAYFRSLQDSGVESIEFTRALKFVDSLRTGIRKGSFEDFAFAHAHPQKNFSFERVA